MDYLRLDLRVRRGFFRKSAFAFFASVSVWGTFFCFLSYMSISCLLRFYCAH